MAAVTLKNMPDAAKLAEMSTGADVRIGQGDRTTVSYPVPGLPDAKFEVDGNGPSVSAYSGTALGLRGFGYDLRPGSIEVYAGPNGLKLAPGRIQMELSGRTVVFTMAGPVFK